MSIPKPSVLNTSRNAVRKYKKRQEREKEIAESFKASSAKVTNLPIIAITRYCKIPNPLSVVSHGIYTELENNFGSRAIFKSVLELFFALTLATLSALSTSQSICKLTLSTSAVSTKYLANSSPQSFSASSVSLVLILPGLKDVFADVK